MPVAPGARRVPVRLGVGRIGVDGAEHLFQADAVPHGQDHLGQHFARAGCHDRNPEDAVPPGRSQHLHEPLTGIVHDGPVKLAQVVAGDLDGDSFGLGLPLVQPGPPDLGLGIGHRGHDGPVRTDAAEVAEQGR